MTPYSNVKPRYVQTWFNNRLQAFLKYTEYKEDKMSKHPEYEAKKEIIVKNSVNWKFTDKKYLTDREQKQVDLERSMEISREKLRALISLDSSYKETVPFADYYPFPDVSTRPVTDMRKMGSGNSSRSQKQLTKVKAVDEYDYDDDPHRDIKGVRLSLNSIKNVQAVKDKKEEKKVEYSKYYGRILGKSHQQLSGAKSQMGMY